MGECTRTTRRMGESSMVTSPIASVRLTAKAATSKGHDQDIHQRRLSLPAEDEVLKVESRGSGQRIEEDIVFGVIACPADGQLQPGRDPRFAVGQNSLRWRQGARCGVDVVDASPPIQAARMPAGSLCLSAL